LRLMKAIAFTKYGPPDLLKLREVEMPVPKDDEALVKVHAASVNAWDWELLRGTPFINRLMFGLFKPKLKALGADIAGRVEAVGREVEQFKPGDEVFGDLCQCGWGGFAEYACARENALSLKPAAITFEQAAAVPQAAVMALQSIRGIGQVQQGQKVLINGAGGGVGSFAVQLAKSIGAHVTGVDSARKLEMVRSIGADHVIDYLQEDYTKSGQRYDMILDTAVHRSIFDSLRALNPKGIYIIVGGSIARIFQIMLLGLLISMIGSKKIRILGLKPNKDLVFIGELIEAGKVVPAIDRRYALSEVPEALRYFGEGHAKGKVVITVEHNNKTFSP
jgi:NADPH:quinone reductase-like Zn-dependent oxidoreductase